ncbi:MAG: hypothetical protein QNJ89_07610 [Acidimicrobiia bacterium]|nr:hypothetical protein [Acidimicrobiia bacterium]
MPHSGTIKVTGWKGTAGSAALMVLAVFSALMLFSFGGQVIVGPVLLPAQWLIARHTREATSIVFSALGALLAAEVTWIALATAFGQEASVLVRGLVVAAGLVVGFVFLKTSRPVAGK